MPYRSRTLCALLAFVPLTGCIKHFDVQPRVVCRGDPATVSWRADSASCRLDVSAGGGGAVGTTGERTINVVSDTTFQLHAITSEGRTQESSSVITVRVAPELYNISAGPRCDGGGRIVDWQVDQPSDDFDRIVFALAIINRWDRPIVVSHQGRTSPQLAPGERDDRTFVGTKVSGSWLVSAPTRTDEGCPGTTSTSTTPYALFSVQTGCSPSRR